MLENLLGKELSNPEMNDKSAVVNAMVDILSFAGNPSGLKSPPTEWGARQAWRNNTSVY